MENTWTARSTPPAAKRMSSLVEDGDSQVQHVAPSDVGNGRVYRADDDDEADVEASDSGSTWTCERYDETKICLVAFISQANQGRPSAYPGRPILNPDTQSSISTLPASSGGIRLLTYSRSSVPSSSPPRFFSTQASKLPRNTSPWTRKSKGMGWGWARTLLMSSESW